MVSANRQALCLLVVVLAAVVAAPAAADLEEEREETLRMLPDFASQNDVGEELEDIAYPHRGLIDLPPWLHRPFHEARGRLTERTGLRFGVTYTTLYQRATSGPGDEDAGLGRMEAIGIWHVLGNLFGEPGRHDGFVGFSIEETHRFTDIAPAKLGSNIGSLWNTTDGFRNRNPAVRQLWWQQHLLDDAVTLTFGKIDPSNYFDGNRMSNADKYFANVAFSLSPTEVQPEEGIGVAVNIEPTDAWWLTLGFGDANGRRTKLGLESFGQHEYFYGVEFGLGPTFEGLGDGHYRIHGWYKDKASSVDIERSYGVSLSFDQEIWVPRDDILFVPFLRFGYQGRNAASTRLFVSVGTGVAGFLEERDDIAGIAFAWGQPAERPRRDQGVMELFYRVQLTQLIRVTPSVQLIFRPSRDPSQDVTGVFGFRMMIKL